MNDFESMKPLFRCPACHYPTLSEGNSTGDLFCESCGIEYPMSFGRPVLLRPDNGLFCLDDYRNAKVPSLDKGRHIWQNFIPSPSVNFSNQRVLSRVRELLDKISFPTVLVVGGGRQRQWLDELLCSGNSVRILYSDIDIGADVDLFCDGHDLPFMDGVFDAVVTTAVLEHVIYPERVATEILRVLKKGGLLYSVLPFMQQVHEGAYDFTRYTMSGHRRLFNGVSEIESGMAAGPATALVWAIENFATAFIISHGLRKVTKAVIRLTFAWIKYFDLLLIDKPAALDGASCTYLLGRKIEGRISDAEIIARYVGANHLKHT